MGKEIILKYGQGQLPDRLGEILGAADENDLKILLTLMMLVDTEGRVLPETDLAGCLGLAQSDIDASLKFWRGAGMIGGRTGKVSAKGAAKPEAEKKAENPVSAHRNGLAQRSGVLPYRSDELAGLVENGRVTPQFIDEAQRIVGKTFNCSDTGIVAALVDQLEFEEEAVLAILSYSVSLGKKSVHYAEKIAMGFFDDGITGTADVIAKINSMERSKDVINQLRNLMGIGSRALTTTEKKLFGVWVEKFGYGMDELRLAYEITVDKTGMPAPKYMNAILEKWYGEGLHTAADITEFEQARKEKKKGSPGKSEKSYDMDDFLEASLKRSYEDLK